MHNGDAVVRKPLSRMMLRSWRTARNAVGLPQLRLHDLKYTFGCWLRAAGVSLEDRQDLLGLKSARITTHYSAAEIKNLIAAANKDCRNKDSTPVLTVLKRTSTNVLPQTNSLMVLKAQ